VGSACAGVATPIDRRAAAIAATSFVFKASPLHRAETVSARTCFHDLSTDAPPESAYPALFAHPPDS
jgi:hypothetical protein